MLEPSDDKTQLLHNLSALADGELDAAATVAAAAQWRSDGQAREAWHAYHLIGDVMRSEELASDTARDAAFLRRLARRLAEEPVVLAPQPAAARVSERPRDRASAGRSRWSWTMPAAVAAGFMAVASVLVVMRGTAPFAEGEAVVARFFGGPGPVVVAGTGAPAAPGVDLQNEPQTLVADGQLIRDARLERYFAAHTQFGGSSALGVPSGFLRAATTQPPGR